MNVIGYIRVSTDTQAMEKQRHLLLEYAQRHQLHIAELINVEVSSRRDTKERRIDALPARFNCVANSMTDSVDLYGGDLCKPIRRNLRCDCVSAVAVIVSDAGPTENLDRHCQGCHPGAVPERRRGRRARVLNRQQWCKIPKWTSKLHPQAGTQTESDAP